MIASRPCLPDYPSYQTFSFSYDPFRRRQYREEDHHHPLKRFRSRASGTDQHPNGINASQRVFLRWHRRGQYRIGRSRYHDSAAGRSQLFQSAGICRWLKHLQIFAGPDADNLIAIDRRRVVRQFFTNMIPFQRDRIAARFQAGQHPAVKSR